MRSQSLMLGLARAKLPTATSPAARSRVITALRQTPATYETGSWYLGYAFEALPDHSSVARIRRRLGIDIFQRFFEQIVDLCQKAGLVWGREFYFDATKGEANAGIPSLIPRFYYEATPHLAEMFADQADDAGLLTDGDVPSGIVQLPIDSDVVPTEDDPPWKLTPGGTMKTSTSYRPASTVAISRLSTARRWLSMWTLVRRRNAPADGSRLALRAVALAGIGSPSSVRLTPHGSSGASRPGTFPTPEFGQIPSEHWIDSTERGL